MSNSLICVLRYLNVFKVKDSVCELLRRGSLRGLSRCVSLAESSGHPKFGQIAVALPPQLCRRPSVADNCSGAAGSHGQKENLIPSVHSDDR